MDEFYLCCNWTQVILCLDLLMLLTENFVKFCMKEVLSVGKEGWWDEMKNGQKLKLGDAHVTPRHIQEVQASKLGDAQGIPFFINKNIRSCFSTLYFYCFICYVLFLERLCFSFQFSLVCCSFWLDPSYLILERNTLRFHCLEHSSFILITLRVFSCC
jgi:hypothetical protein